MDKSEPIDLSGIVPSNWVRVEFVAYVAPHCDMERLVDSMRGFFLKTQRECTPNDPPLPAPKDEPIRIKKRECNRHVDCDEADAKASAVGKRVDHCHDDCCEDCFGS